MKQLLIGLSAATCLIAPVNAADMPVKASPAVVAAYSWSGWYIGVNAGGAFGWTRPGLAVDDIPGNYFTFGAGQPANVLAVDAAGNRTFSNSGFTGGGQFGRLWQEGRLVYGFEVDFEYFNPKGSNVVNGFLPAPAFALPGPVPVPFTITNSSSGSWLSTQRLRVGQAYDNWLFYGTFGSAIASVKLHSTYADGTTAPPQVSATLRSNFSSGTKVLFGFAGGVGGEYALAGNWSIRAEYLAVYLPGYRNFGSTVALPTTGVVPAPGTCPPGGGGNGFCSVFKYSPSFVENIFRVGINYRFDAGLGPVVARN